MKKTATVSWIACLVLLFGLPIVAQAEVNFYPPVNLSNNSGLSFNPSIAVDPTDGSIFVVWNDNTFGGNEILFAKSTDKGKSFSTPLNISNNLGMSTFPSIAVDKNGIIHVIWQDTEYGTSEILYSRSMDKGKTFSVPTNISNDAGCSVETDLTVDDNGNLYAVWRDESNLWLTHSTDGGDSWATVYNLPTSNTGIMKPRLATGMNNAIHLSWVQGVEGGWEIRYAYSVDLGNSFSVPVVLSLPGAQPGKHSMSADKAGNVYVIWSDQADTRDLFLTRSMDCGISFANPVNITNNQGISITPDLKADSVGNLYVVWEDTTPGNYETMFMYSKDHGTTFSPQLNVAPSELGSLITKVAVDANGIVCIVWDDNRFGSFEILVARGWEGLPAIENATATPAVFSPNGDGVNDTITFTASFTDNLKWQLDIINGNNRVATYFRGEGKSLNQIWNGKDFKERTVAEGKYTFNINGTAGDTTPAVSATGNFKVSNAADSSTPILDSFLVVPTIFGPDGDGRRETIAVTAEFNKVLTWTLSYRAFDGREVFSQHGLNASIDAIWDGRDYTGTWVNDGEYQVELTATDDWGQSLAAEEKITVDTTHPELTNFIVTPKIFTPNGDGIDDTTTLSFDLSEAALITVYIYEKFHGSLIRELFRDGFYAPTHLDILWDGKSATGVTVAKGNYIFKIWCRDYAANKATVYPYIQSVTVQ